MRSRVIDARPKRWGEHLEVILKLAERCNINCSYCYVFNGVDKSFKNHPARVGRETIHEVAAFLRRGCLDLGIKALQIDFHGGEPLMIGKRRFAEICGVLEEKLQGVTKLTLALQTNATLVDEEWIDLFERYRVSPGISLDGPPSINDAFRVDFKGRGTYLKTTRGLALLRDAFNEGRINSVGILAVINPRWSAKRIYDHLVHNLGIRTLDFLFPDCTHDTVSHVDDGSVGRFLCDAYDAWIDDDDPRVSVRVLESVLSLMLGGRSRMIGFGGEMPAAISIASDGTLGPDDTLRACGENFFSLSENVRHTSLAGFALHPLMQEVITAGQTVPKGCRSCSWERVCRGGHLIHRFCSTKRFENRSVFCRSLMRFYAHVAAHLLESEELTIDSLVHNLGLGRHEAFGTSIRGQAVAVV